MVEHVDSCPSSSNSTTSTTGSFNSSTSSCIVDHESRLERLGEVNLCDITNTAIGPDNIDVEKSSTIECTTDIHNNGVHPHRNEHAFTPITIPGESVQASTVPLSPLRPEGSGGEQFEGDRPEGMALCTVLESKKRPLRSTGPT